MSLLSRNGGFRSFQERNFILQWRMLFIKRADVKNAEVGDNFGIKREMKVDLQFKPKLRYFL